MQKSFLREYRNTTIPLLSILAESFGGTEGGTSDLKRLLGHSDAFPYPKPVGLLQMLVAQAATAPGDVVMDLFAGSGTMAEAVLRQNAKDGLDRQFVLVENDAGTAELARERIRRCRQHIGPNSAMMDQRAMDIGLRTYRLETVSARPAATEGNSNAP